MKLGKIQITFKDPDGVYDAIHECASRIMEEKQIPDELIEEASEKYSENIRDKIKPWVLYNEYLTVEIDLDSNTIRIVKPE